MPELRIVFRADAAHSLGTGHVMRCLNLADALADRGALSTFICSRQPGHLGDIIRARGHELEWLPDQTAEVPPAYADALPLAWQADAAATRAILGARGIRPDWLVVDHYSLDRQWEAAVRNAASRIMAIDDLTGREHQCDVLLNQNLVAASDEHLIGQTGDATVLLGPRYALMSPRYAALRRRIPRREGPIRRLLIVLGDAGGTNVPGRVLEGAVALRRDDVLIDVVIALRSPHAEAIRALAASHPNVTVHQSVPDLANLIAAADLAIGGAGMTSWERACLGRPAVVIDLAENQTPLARALAENGLARWIGSALRRVLASSRGR